METRMHGNWGHGLRKGETSNCRVCQEEDARALAETPDEREYHRLTGGTGGDHTPTGICPECYPDGDE